MNIKKVFRHDLFRFVKGDNFVKGDHLFRDTTFEAILVNGNSAELSPNKIREYYNGQRISQQRLDGLVGLDHKRFTK